MAGMADEAFTETELAFLRHVRFGEMPARVRPEERVEVAETEVPRDWVDVGLSREQQRAVFDAAG